MDGHPSGPAPLHASRAFYHRFAWAYDLIIARPGGPQVQAVAEVFARRGLGSGATVVDAGCGTGAYAAGLGARGFQVIAVDRSHELVALAAEEHGVSAEFVCADFTLGWHPASPVDGVLCRGVLNDLVTDDERERAFGAFASWLRPGGMLLVDVRDLDGSQRRYDQGRTFERTAQRNDDLLTFQSVTSMQPGAETLEIVEHWNGTVDGERVAVENRFEMRCWTSGALEQLALAGGFRAVTALKPAALGARSDRLIALAFR